MTGMGRAVYLYLKGLWWGSGGANGRESDRAGWGESQQVVGGEAYISASAGIPHPDTTPPQPNHNVTRTHIVPEQYNP